MFIDVFKICIVIVYFVILLKQKSLFERVKNKDIRDNLHEVMRVCKIKYNNWFLSILLPIISIAGLWFIIWCKFGRYTENSAGGLFHNLSVVTFNPIFEELFFRGIFLGVVFIVFPRLVFKKYGWGHYDNWKWSFIPVGVLTVSIMFSFSHEYKMDLRFLSSIAYSILYLIDKRNLLPAIIGHSLNNIISTFILKC